MKKDDIPKKSKHLILNEIENGEFVLTNDSIGHNLKVNQATVNVIKLVNGQNSTQDICDIISNPKITVDILHRLLFEELGQYGLIESEYVEVKTIDKPSYLKLSFTLLDAKKMEPILDLLSPIISLKTFYPILILSILITLTTLISYREEIIPALNSVDTISWIVLFVLSGISIFIHEFGHAATCRKFGAKHGSIGFGFYLLSPAMYADVSNIWTLKKKLRIIVNFAGIYLESILTTFLSLIFIITREPLILSFCFLVMLSILSNLNPFFRYDGYWILSDVIEVPNLREESNKILYDILKKNVIAKGVTKKQIFLALYAFLSNFFIFIFIGYIIINDPYGVLYLPINIYNYIKGLLIDSSPFLLSSLYQFLLPLIFYFVIIRLGIVFASKLFKKKLNGKS